MEILKIENLTFAYPNRKKAAIKNLSMGIDRGEFLVLMGKSGSGKSTLLRNFKPALIPNGEKSGYILFEEKENIGYCEVEKLNERVQAASIGFVLQNPDNQIVTDRVWHELAFGLENLGLEKETIRVRVSEMASFFGIQSWFDKDTKELSGGQKQILNLASIMVMKPEVLILDEPTSQLDPIAAADFIQMIKKINREIGTTIIISEHRLDELLPLADRVIVLEEGEIIAKGTPSEVGEILSAMGSDMFTAMPSPMQAYEKVYKAGYGEGLECPVDIRGGRLWLNKILSGVELIKTKIEEEKNKRIEQKVIELKDIWFRYSKNGNDIVRGLKLNIREGEIFAIVGGNGTGKTTSLKIIAGIEKAYRGSVLICGEKIEKYNDKKLRNGLIGMMPQDPQSIFVEDIVRHDLMEVLTGRGFTSEEKEEKIKNVSKLTQIVDLLEAHPYDVSGGEQQRIALAKILLLDPKVILLDEPTKGIDNFFKGILGEILLELKSQGKTIILVSHDIEFSGKYADRCAMFFDGKIATEGTSRKFFSGNSFYTTSANKMSSGKFENAITAEDVAELVIENIKLQGNDFPSQDMKLGESNDLHNAFYSRDIERGKANVATLTSVELEESKGIDSADIDLAKGDVAGTTDAESGIGLFVISDKVSAGKIDQIDNSEDTQSGKEEIQSRLGTQLKEKLKSMGHVQSENLEGIINRETGDITKKKLSSRQKGKIVSVLSVAAIVLMLGLSVKYGGNSNFLLTSIMMIFLAMVPFFFAFEAKKPTARELVLVSVIIALAVAGRAAFFMFPQVKPILAVVIAGSFCTGPNFGCIIGAMSAFMSNFLFGQGPWTPWQMLGMGIIGLLAGLLGRFKLKNTLAISIFGGVVTFLIYGLFVDFWTVFGFSQEVNLETIALVYMAAIPFNLVFAISTTIFLLMFGKPMINKINRIKTKYKFANEEIRKGGT